MDSLSELVHVSLVLHLLVGDASALGVDLINGALVNAGGNLLDDLGAGDGGDDGEDSGEFHFYYTGRY